ncbi:histidine phosphatase family protein [Alkalihalobacillus sp. LMS39]|uniref:histidine phosphatase family protein n=1 Tax=Alkalihalobacillus sp. LMS39 TaxID=2924032 RepID=UPI001FB548CF|nr:histidine phosphatase family protein [Alkalihalobacillus sp. LMS39]UOE92214.1 histidine phosphatase family protein [Alkalihalobacillus sp. LMS39]
MKVLLIRHGKSEKSGGGQIDIPLSEKGVLQAQKVSQYLAKHHPIDRIYSSPLTRALHTAQAIGETTGTPIQVDVQMMERTSGIFDGYTNEEREERYPSEWLYFSNHRAEAAPNGESLFHLDERVSQVMDRVVDASSNDTIAIVSHGEWINLFLHKVLEVPLYHYPMFKVKPASVSLLSFKKTGQKVVHYLNRV